MINRIKDWKVQIAQTFLPLLVIPAVFLLDVLQKILDIFNKTKVDVTELKWCWRVVLALGNWAIIAVLLFIIYRAIRKHNKKDVLKQNLAVIVWHSYPGYIFCRWVLNYQKVSLTRIPIPIQFKLVWMNLFKEYICMDGVREIEKELETIKILRYQDSSVTSTINLVLADTYPLNWKSQIPASVLNLTTITIDRFTEKGVRFYSPDFVSKISDTIHNLPSNVVEINVFATTNAAHVFHIVNDVFKTGARDVIKRIRIYQQTSGSWVFEGKNIEIETGV